MPRITAPIVKWCRGTLPALAGLALAAAAVGAYAAITGHARRSPLRLTARPTRQTIAPGGIARYRITIHGQRLPRHLRLRVRGVPRYATARIRFLRDSHRRRAMLTIFTSLRTRRRLFGLRIRAARGRLRAALPLALAVDRPHPARFTIAGNALASLWPGIPEPLDLTLANPNRAPIRVTGVEVALQQLSAPNATPSRPCSLADFAVQQFSGRYPITLPGLTSRSLDVAGLAQLRWPQVEIIDRPVDQDGCQGATLTLSYSGSASSP